MCKLYCTGYHSIYYTYGKKNWYEEVWKTVNLRNHAIVFRVAACKQAWIGFGTTCTCHMTTAKL